jgi:NAD(P)-dependent dehydrogenase (short-subunit alcohol dehydrogenase family)
VDVTVTDRACLVTGASRGIGQAIVAELLHSGARGVVITGRRPETLEEVARELDPDRVHPVPGNASDPEHAAAAVQAAVDTFGACDVLVNNAGTNPAGGAIMDVDMAAVDKTWDVNLRAPLVFAREAWHRWMGEHGGAIVNIGSVGGLSPSPFIGAYNVSKAALHHLTRQLAHEMAPGVRVNAVAAAIVKTRLSRALYEHDEEAVARTHPLHRLGTPEDVARAVTWLASEQASWITGIVMPVDGGVSGAAAGLVG